MSVTLLLQDRVEEAAAAAAKETTPWARPFAVAIARWAQGKRAEADAALQELEKSYAQFAAYQVAQVYAYRGETDRAFAWLDRAYRQRDTGLSFVKSDPLLDSLHRDPRWREFLGRMGLTDDQLK